MEKKSFKERKRIVYELITNELYVPMKEKELACFLQVEPDDRDELKAILNELILENRIEISKRGKYSKATRKVVTGTFISNNRGFGFIEIEGEKEDLFVPASQVNGAFHKDVVEAVIIAGKGGKGKRTEASVVNVISHGITSLVGTFQKSNNYGFVVPDNQKICQDVFIAKEHTLGAVDGHKVVVTLTNYGNHGKNPEGKVTEILGHITDPGVDIMSVVRAYDLPMEFPEKVMNQAERIPDSISDADMAGREDLRDVLMVTIDSEDAKDLDDAVSLTVKEDGYTLGVHIADVANYVQESSALDREAIERGTSVYLVDRVIPMLPRRLSNGICSLNAGEDRLAMSCIMEVDKAGQVKDYRIVESVINVNHRLSYNGVQKIFNGDKEEKAKYEDAARMLREMLELSLIIRSNRKKRGSIDFDMPESKIVLDSNGKPIDIKPYEHNDATRLIEDFMLIANETVAGHMFWQDMPFVYRTHETPDPEKIDKLAVFIANFGYYIKGEHSEIHPKELQKLLASIEGRDEESIISRLTLRSMKQARYSTECSGHFGLATKEYCHFTSPIRRYPDLQIHRILKDEIRGRLNDKKIEHYQGILDVIAKQCSDRERRADEAERETDKLKKAEFMEDKIGEIFDGIISGVTQHGIFVELPNTVEGFIPINKISGDYYDYNEYDYELRGQATGRRFKLGQKLTIQVNSVDMMLKSVEFVLPEN